MTPLGHTSISFLVGVGITKALPNINPNLILIATTVGGTTPDLDLLYRYVQTNGGNILDKTIGKHRYLPSHTPLFLLLTSVPLVLINHIFGLFFFIGTQIHLLLDTLFFPEGINFIFPFGKKFTRFFYIKTHPFWAPKPISQVDNWYKNYLISPLFWIFEVLPTIIALVILFK